MITCKIYTKIERIYASMYIKNLVSQMTLEEKCSLLSGQSFWHTQAIERLGIPAFMVSDGPCGLRKQTEGGDHLGISSSIEAVCFPAACATASSFDRTLLFELGDALGKSCQHESLSVILGPGVNIKRSPLCGRNFEYFSEDPYLSSQSAAALINGVQQNNVGASLKHFAMNNQEHRRMTSSSNADERTMREIYLAAFEGAVKDAQPWTVMCSYNKINGSFAGESEWLLTKVLRDEWGFEGYVMTDWGGVKNRVEGVKAGLDLEMPGSGGINDKAVLDAVNSGQLDESYVDACVERILTVHYRFHENMAPETPWDKEAQHALAARMAAECAVLLKNDDNVLPLSEKSEVAFIGLFAEAPRYQGSGSSHINSFKVTSAVEAAQGLLVTYAQGYDTAKDETDNALLAEAVEAAKNAKAAVVFAGLPSAFESEGYDRKHMRMPNCQNELIAAVAAANPNTIVVLHNGSPVEMPWLNDVKAVLEMYLGGQAVGQAAVDLLYGRMNPSGRLAETFPKHLEDNPSYLFFRGEGDIVEYREGVFVGYRYYDKKKLAPLFPFGHGLSYTSFDYSNLTLSADSISDTDTVTVTVDVTNTGAVAGKEVVQLYVADLESSVIRPIRELKGYEKLTLEPGETKTASFLLDKRAFAYWNDVLSDWHVETGVFEIQIGRSSSDLALTAPLTVNSTVKVPQKFTLYSTMGDIFAYDKGREVFGPLIQKVLSELGSGDPASGPLSSETGQALISALPVSGLLSFGGGRISQEMLQGMIDMLN